MHDRCESAGTPPQRGIVCKPSSVCDGLPLSEARQNPTREQTETINALCGSIRDAEDAIMAAVSVSLTDIERKLTIISNWGGDHLIEADVVDGILADVRRMAGATS